MEETIAQIQVAWALLKRAIPVAEIAAEVGKDRATIYRWRKEIKRYGVRDFIRRDRTAKKGRRRRKTHAYVEQRVLSLGREYRGCCGQKLVYLLKQEGIGLSLSTVYRILNKHLKLRKHHRTPKGQTRRKLPAR